MIEPATALSPKVTPFALSNRSVFAVVAVRVPAAIPIPPPPPGAATDIDSCKPAVFIVIEPDMFAPLKVVPSPAYFVVSPDNAAVVMNAGTPRFNPAVLCVITIFVPAVVCVPDETPAYLVVSPESAAVVRNAGKFSDKPDEFAVMDTPFAVNAVFSPIASVDARPVVIALCEPNMPCVPLLKLMPLLFVNESVWKATEPLVNETA